ncbi:plastocyanin/azurin family copper-binding protein [Nocardia fluminea]|uniref:Copper binding plastocyanin/azurin family protein n=1 Tax=Nocardia fluminea TaxID=134984 RepID=A0A2N3V838_9NOCA|nr:plastocyanin/azurin family copper-binding protein [Nocardia fluminea]PKV77765.1 copper binding plastocyanin/azurin family protein [Nocardia fluminea]
MSMVRHRAASTRFAAGFVVAAALFSAGCSGDSGNAATTTTRKPRPVTTTTTQQHAPTNLTVEVGDMKYAPADATIKVGETVTWKFSDKVPHNVQGIGDKAMGLNSPIFDKGEWSYTFTQPGTYRYMCTLHPDMRGSITVS